MKRMIIRALSVTTVVCGIVLASSTNVFAVNIYAFGKGGRPWQEVGTYALLDFSDGSIHPVRLDSTKNLALKVEMKADPWNLYSIGNQLPNVTDGNRSTVYVWKSPWNSEIKYSVDLGARFIVTNIRFYPAVLREIPPARFPQDVEFSENFLPKYRLQVNDGNPNNVTDQGKPIFTTVKIEDSNVNPYVDITLPPQLVRHVRLLPDPAVLSWEVAELEVYGEGYVPDASYTSQVIDLKDIASWGKLRWSGTSDPGVGAKVIIRTRSGTDDDPNVYWMKTGRDDEIPFNEETRKPLTKNDYNSLPPGQKGRITYDTDNWSFWSPPYPFERGPEGVPIVSPGPRRYFQVQVDFSSPPTQGGRIDSLSFEFSQPPVAHEIVAEIWPVAVTPGEMTSFTYTLRPTIKGQDTGFDRLALDTPVRADTIRAVRIDGREVIFTVEKWEDDGFQVKFPKVTRDNVVEVGFDCRVFRYGTSFNGRVSDSQSNEVAQLANAGDAMQSIPSNSIMVQTSLDLSLIAGVTVAPNPITPNGDGINDEAIISYQLFQLISGGRVLVAIYDPSGREVRRLRSADDTNGEYTLRWDGRDDDGQTVPPGIYVYRLSVEADTGTKVETGVISVIY